MLEHVMIWYNLSKQQQDFHQSDVSYQLQNVDLW